ncbi:hypothetical protein [Chryseobacterium angstadtii]|nr:hypothetical protein [Chryseobacterium angstadtii]
MDNHFYVQKFQEAVDTISLKEFTHAGLKFSVDFILESIALKIYKPEWSSNMESPIDAPGRIFFSVWVNEKSVEQKKVYYNIHALKLRNIKGYTIQARSFADDFRKRFEEDCQNWENVSVKYGPLTLMEGWIELNPDHLVKDLHFLAEKFLNLSPVIDEILTSYRSKI